MKKVLSVLLAAAMVMGMSVSAFAAKATGTSNDKVFTDVTTAAKAKIDNNFAWDTMYVVRDNAIVDITAPVVNDEIELEAGDELYFTFKYNNVAIAAVPSNWDVEVNNSTYVEDAEFVVIDGTTTGADTAMNNYWFETWAGAFNTATKTYPNLVDSAEFDWVNSTSGWGVKQEKISAVDNKAYTLGGKEVAVKVTLESDYDSFEAGKVAFYMVVEDNYYNTTSPKAKVNYDSAAYAEVDLSKADLDWVIDNNVPTIYTYTGNVAKVATIDMNNEAYAEFTMWPKDEYTVYASSKYNKELSKEYDESISVVTFKLGNAEGVELFFEAAKDNKQIVAIVDGELVAVEAEFVKDHKFAAGSKATGYLVSDVEYDAYAVVSADLEIAEEEVEAPVETPVEADKANPETGAADFVGAAVAMAVVSVAAAGALALKK